MKKLIIGLAGALLAASGLAFAATASASTDYDNVTPGAWCAKADAGKHGRTATGLDMVCTGPNAKGRYRWRECPTPTPTVTSPTVTPSETPTESPTSTPPTRPTLPTGPTTSVPTEPPVTDEPDFTG